MTRKIFIPPARIPRPATIAEAKRVISEAMDATDWDETEQKIYQEQIGVAGFDSEEDVRTVIADLESSKMILFFE